MTRVAVTGANGFIGRGVVQALCDAGCAVVAITRSPPAPGLFADSVDIRAIGELAEGSHKLGEAFSGADLIVHLADNPERDRQGSASEALARAVGDAAGSAGVRRIVFASSIYAARENAGMGEYGAGKRAAEILFADNPDLDAVRLRLPPVYGPGGKGGFALVTKLVARGWPLPLGLAKAPRAYLSRDNLGSLIVALAMLDDAAFAKVASQAWEPHDVAVSTADLARAIAQAQGKAVTLLPVPPWLLAWPATLAGKRIGVEAVFSPLSCADTAELKKLTGWTPSTDLVANLGYLRT